MLPEGMHIRIDEGVLYWQNHAREALTAQEARIVADAIREMIDRNGVRAIVVDNRQVNGNWSPEVDRIWIDLMADLPRHVERTATLCKNPVSKLQLNYLSSQAGTEGHVKAFTDEERQSMMEFLHLTELHLLSE